MTDLTGAQSGATGDAQSGGPGTQGAATDPATGGQSATGTPGVAPPADGQSAVSQADYDRLKAQLQAADKRFSDTDAALKQLRDKDMPELQKLQRDLTETQQMMSAMKAANEQLRVENAFLTDNTHDWHSPAAALQLLDRSKVLVDADGNVTGMKDALKALAQANPFLLKPKPAEGDGEGTGTGTPPPPGTAPANGGIGQQAATTPDKEAMAKRFPALRQRM
jgi:Phage minor structural protein GP20